MASARFRAFATTRSSTESVRFMHTYYVRTDYVSTAAPRRPRTPALPPFRHPCNPFPLPDPCLPSSCALSPSPRATRVSHKKSPFLPASHPIPHDQPSHRRRHSHWTRAPQSRLAPPRPRFLLRRPRIRAHAANGQLGRLHLRRRIPPTYRAEHLGKRPRPSPRARHHRPLPPRHPLPHPRRSRRLPSPPRRSRNPARGRRRPRRQRSPSTSATPTTTASNSIATARNPSGRSTLTARSPCTLARSTSANSSPKPTRPTSQAASAPINSPPAQRTCSRTLSTLATPQPAHPADGNYPLRTR